MALEAKGLTNSILSISVYTWYYNWIHINYSFNDWREYL